MRLNTQTDFALRTLIYLAVHAPEGATIQEISQSYGISQNHLMRVAAKLVRIGCVDSVRGRGGGLRLAKHPSEITVGQIVREFEPDMQLVPCFGEADRRCRIEPACRLKETLGAALSAFLAELDQTTLAQISTPRPKLRSLLVIQ